MRRGTINRIRAPAVNSGRGSGVLPRAHFARSVRETDCAYWLALSLRYCGTKGMGISPRNSRADEDHDPGVGSKSRAGDGDAGDAQAEWRETKILEPQLHELTHARAAIWLGSSAPMCRGCAAGRLAMRERLGFCRKRRGGNDVRPLHSDFRMKYA